jgi:hypothetical protein
MAAARKTSELLQPLLESVTNEASMHASKRKRKERERGKGKGKEMRFPLSSLLSSLLTTTEIEITLTYAE